MPAEFGAGGGWFGMALRRRQAIISLVEIVSSPRTHIHTSKR